MNEPKLRLSSSPQPSPALQQQRLVVLQTLLETLTEGIIQDLSAIQIASDSLLYGWQRERTFSRERLRTSLELITTACQKAAESIQRAQRELTST